MNVDSLLRALYKNILEKKETAGLKSPPFKSFDISLFFHILAFLSKEKKTIFVCPFFFTPFLQLLLIDKGFTENLTFPKKSIFENKKQKVLFIAELKKNDLFKLKTLLDTQPTLIICENISRTRIQERYKLTPVKPYNIFSLPTKFLTGFWEVFLKYKKHPKSLFEFYLYDEGFYTAWVPLEEIIKRKFFKNVASLFSKFLSEPLSSKLITLTKNSIKHELLNTNSQLEILPPVLKISQVLLFSFLQYLQPLKNKKPMERYLTANGLGTFLFLRHKEYISQE
jgi:hypothetical protein